jgi:hypothetical protein
VAAAAMLTVALYIWNAINEGGFCAALAYTSPIFWSSHL